MIRILFMAVIGALSFLSCTSNRSWVATSFYQLQGNDSVAMEKYSLPADSLQILLVKMSVDDTPLMDDFDFDRRGGYISTTTGKCSQSQPMSGTDMSHSKIMGTVRNQWLNEMVLSRMFTRLKEIPVKRVKLISPPQETIDRSHLDSLLKRHTANRVVTVDSIVFLVNQERLSSTYHTDGLVPLPPGGGMTSHHMFSSSSVVNYRLYLTLFDINESTREIEKRSRLLQTGNYKDYGNGSPMEMVTRCALKAGDDFALLFTPVANQHEVKR